VVSGVSYLVASTYRPDLRPLLYGAAFLLFSIAPFTIVVCKHQTLLVYGYTQLMTPPTVVPINKVILKMANDVSKSDAKSPDSGLMDRLFSEWRKYNTVRLSIAAVAWGLGAAALLLA
jgi:hypothetical protein